MRTSRELFDKFHSAVISDLIDDAVSDQLNLQQRENALCSALQWVGPNSPVDIVSKFQEAFTSFFQAVLDDIHGGACHAVAPALFIKNTCNEEIIQMALPHLKQVLRPASRSPDNFGRLACDYLDMGGDINALIDPVKLILESQEAAPCGENSDSPEERLARHLCCEGFIAFLNHQRLNESSELRDLLRPFAGQIIGDQTEDTFGLPPVNTCVLVSLQGGRPNLIWGTEVMLYHTSIGDLRALKAEFNSAQVPQEVIDLARDLFAAKESDDMVGEVERTALCATKDWDLG